MTPVEERLRTLLQQAPPDTAGVSFEAVARRARHRHRVLAAASVSVTAVMVTALAIGAHEISGVEHDRVATAPAPPSGVTPRSVAFQGIKFELPDGWSVAQPHCASPADHTVVLATHDRTTVPNGPLSSATRRAS